MSAKFKPGDRVCVLVGQYAGERLPVVRYNKFGNLIIDPSDGGKDQWRKREWRIRVCFVRPASAIELLGDLA